MKVVEEAVPEVAVLMADAAVVAPQLATAEHPSREA